MKKTITLCHPQGTINIEETSNGKRRIQTYNGSSFAPLSSFETSYPVDLISLMLQTRGPSYVHDEISRDEDYYYQEDRLISSISAYISLDEFRDKKLLDFGCGSRASTMILSRNFPHTEIVGVDMLSDLMPKEKSCVTVSALRGFVCSFL